MIPGPRDMDFERMFSKELKRQCGTGHLFVKSSRVLGVSFYVPSRVVENGLKLTFRRRAPGKRVQAKKWKLIKVFIFFSNLRR